ncbi:hypothetical protein HMPREF9371_1508 [Neisseria shayeganii 871]|uniref:Uncharacterized protein n=1 Tax=Neisseria shayeganii 871 TaxID=1032488 RepID=G4CIR9_9NEIS|nr:hypothetical protein HMPREF9371_1508 [Neisseria shayeganii 871]
MPSSRAAFSAAEAAGAQRKFSLKKPLRQTHADGPRPEQTLRAT